MSHVLHERTARPSAHTHIVAAMTREARSAERPGQTDSTRGRRVIVANFGQRA